MTMKEHLDRGNQAEEIAARYLKGEGYELLERNYRCRQGEIDIIASKDHTIHFVEVKGRWSAETGGPLEQVTARKMKQIARVALVYLQRHQKLRDWRAFFSVLGVDNRSNNQQIQWVPDAFDLPV